MGELIRREAAANPLEFSGERLTAAISGQVEIEHYHRYLFARELCRGRDVLDVAAGEGYGTALLAQVAASAVGVEIDAAVVDAARREFVRPNLRFEQGDARAIPLPDASVDVAVSFETLEHLAEQDVFVAELRRVLRPGGLLIISTPDRDCYSPAGMAPNPYHVLELTGAEFGGLLGRHFGHIAVSAQRSLIGSVILPTDGSASLHSFERRSAELIEGSQGLSRAPYLVAFASDGPLPPLPGSVYVYRGDLDTDMQVRVQAEHGQRRAEAAAADSERRAAAAEARIGAAEARVAGAEAGVAVAEEAAAAARAETQDIARRGAADLAAAGRRLAEVEAESRRAGALAAARQERAEHKAAVSEQRAVAAEARSAALEQALQESHRRHAELDMAVADRDRALVGTQARAGDLERRLAAEMTGHFEAIQRIQALEAQVRGIEYSTAWRITRPMRTLGTRFPRLARRLRQGGKLLWWTGTLQLPRRYAAWRRNKLLRLGPPEPFIQVASDSPAVLAAPDATDPPPMAAAPPPPIRVPFSDAPVVTVIIPSYGQVGATVACLQSIAAHPPETPIEVIVIDDAYPGPEDLGPLRAVEGIQLVRNGTNQGYLRSCNLAARSARGEFIHLLNNDTELRPGAIDALVRLLRARQDAGLAGSKLVYPDGRLQEAGGIVWDDASGWNYGRGDDPSRPEYTSVREVDYCTGASIMLRASLWRTLGGYDEVFLPSYYEDTDLAFRVRAQGLKVLYEPRSVVVHHEGVTHGRDLTQGVKAAQVVNQAKMLERWGDVLRTEHYPPAEHLMRASSRGRTRTTILVIDHYVPEPDRDAGSRSTMGILTSLLDAGWIVKFWPHNRAHSPGYTEALEEMGIEVLDYRWPGDLGAWMREHGSEIDHLMAIRPDIAADIMQHVMRNTDAMLSFYGVDLHFARVRRQAVLDGNPQLMRDAAAMERLERRVWRNFDVVLYPSEEEAAMVRSMAPGTVARGIVPFWFQASEPRTQPPADKTILFVAGFAHPPNVDAALFLVDEIIPRLEQEVGPVKVTLAGSNPSAAVRALAGRDIEVTGYVTDPELERMYGRHRVSVVPLRFGAGVKGKVVESLSRGLPVVTTSIGAQGIDGIGEVVPVRDDVDAIVAALKTFLTDDAAWVAQSAAQVAFARRCFSRAAMGRSVLTAMERPG